MYLLETNTSQVLGPLISEAPRCTVVTVHGLEPNRDEGTE